MDERLTKPYNAAENEARIYKKWEEGGYFRPEIGPADAKPFTIIMPLPNANGRLHAGHALAMGMQDVMTRYKRMQGFRALWVPGADHAGFETQIVYEKKLEKEGRSRFTMEREDLYREILAFTLENKKFMEADVRALGASCDWTREKFTLDADVITEVQKTFKKMFDDGLVYRGKRMVNWCTKHQTSLSDVETEFIERTDPFYYFKYGPFTIGTARPETKFGDKYVVMHPEDERYAEYTDGQKIELGWINGPITATVVKDESVDREFGTGVMTITPWHDATDFEIAERHKLDKEQIIDDRGKLLPIAQEFAGMKITEAREKIVAKLKEKGLLEKIDEQYVHNVKTCYKCNTPIEPQIRDQWFVKMRPLAEKALSAVDKGKITFIPDNFRKIFQYWMNNTIDWNISRQIVWGIPIPAKICEKCGEGFPDLDNTIANCAACGGAIYADTDTFDTWFSSGQWPLLSLGYSQGNDYKTYHPTDVMETGHDLIFRWIPRMVIFSLYLVQEVPFHTVYLHGLVNDAHGKKMSKSKGNVISPIDLVEKYGADALRMGLIVGNAPGTDLALREDKIKGYKHFANKLWNIARFVFENVPEILPKPTLTSTDEAYIKELNTLIAEVTQNMEAHLYHIAAEKLYAYIWNTFASTIIEETKIRLPDGSVEEQQSAKYTLHHILSTTITLLHPFMPFVTETIWQMIPTKTNLLIVESWPVSHN